MAAGIDSRMSLLSGDTCAKVVYFFVSFVTNVSLSGSVEFAMICPSFVSGDLYVHADLHGASSIVIKNPSGEFRAS